MRKMVVLLIPMFVVFLFSCSTQSPIKQKYVVSFDTSISIISEIADVEVNEGDRISEPTIVQNVVFNERNLEFEGWYLFGEYFDFNSEITQDITLVARWKIIDIYQASLSNLYSPNVISGSRVYIAKITHRMDVSFNVHPVTEISTKYGIDTLIYLKGSVNNGYVWISGGEVESNIYKYFDLYPFPVKIGYYHLIYEYDVLYNEGDLIPTGLYGFTRIPLETYDSSKTIEEQNEETLAIIQPFIDAIDSYNNSLLND